MSSSVSKQIQKSKDEIKELKKENRNQKEAHENKIQYLKKTNRDQNDAHEDQTQNLERTNRDQNEAHEDQTQNLEQTNRDQNEAHEDQTQNLEQTNLDQIEAHEDQTQNLEQELCTKFSNLNVYCQIAPSPVSVDKKLTCTVWWCPKHSNFANIVKTFKPNSDKDELKVNRAKKRIQYWDNGKNGVRCCFHDRKNKDSNKFAPPSNWPK